MWCGKDDFGFLELYCFGVFESCASQSKSFQWVNAFLYVSGSGSITSVGEERVNLSAVVNL